MLQHTGMKLDLSHQGKNTESDWVWDETR